MIERVPGGMSSHAFVRSRVVDRGRYVGGGEQGRQVPEVEVGLDEVGQRQGGIVGRTAGPGGVEDGPRAREVARDGGAAADLDDGGVAAGPGGEVAQRAAARGEEADLEFLVARPAGAEEDGDPVLRVGLDDADLVGAPVADRPERIRVAPQELGAHRVHGLAVASGGARQADLGRSGGGTAPPTNHRIDASTGCGQPVHRTNSAPCCHEDRVREGPWSGLRPLECAPANTSRRWEAAAKPIRSRCEHPPRQGDHEGFTGNDEWAGVVGDANAPGTLRKHLMRPQVTW